MAGMRKRSWIKGFVGVVSISAIATFASIAPVQAQTAADTRQAAIDMWLSDRELAGLTALSSLAKAGDVPSQLLLGLIDKMTELQGPAVLVLSREERLELLRAPGGMSGRNWVHEAAEQGHPVAVTWQKLWSVEADLDIAKSFAKLGEARAMTEALITLVKRRDTGFAPDVLAQAWYPQALLMLSEHRVLNDEDASKLHDGDPQHRFGSAGAPSDPNLQAWLATAEPASAIRAACDAECPDMSSDCALALYRAIGNYQVLLGHGSPVETLIPEAQFVASQRGRAALARRIMLMRSTRMREAQILKLAEIDSCAADWLAMHYQSYSLLRIPTAE